MTVVSLIKSNNSQFKFDEYKLNIDLVIKQISFYQQHLHHLLFSP